MALPLEQNDLDLQDHLYAIAERTLPGAGLGGYSLPKDLRFAVSAAEGAHLICTQGRRYIDFVGGAGANILGANHPEVVAAIQAQAAKAIHVFGTLNEAAILLSEKLVAAIPCAEKICFTTTGSEATAYALRIARAFTGKDKVLKFEGAYHGNHDYASFSQFPTAAANYPQATADSGGVPRALQDTMLVAPYNDLEAVEQIAAAEAEDLAAIVVEPVQRVIFPQQGFLAGLRRLADAYGVLLIFDEVVTGFRLAYGGGQEYFGVTPDLASFGKIVGGSGPLGCVAGRAEMLERTNPRNKGRPDYAYINGTLHGNPLAAAAGAATLDVIAQPGFYENLNQKAEAFYAAMQAVLDRHSLPARVTGRASLWQFLFAAEDPKNQLDILAADQASARKLDLALLKRGIYVLPTVRRFFSGVLSEEDLETTLAALDEACQELRA